MTNVTPIRPESTARLIEELQRVSDNSDHAPRSSGGGGSMLEARVAKLEAAMEYVQRDLGEIRKDIREIKDHARTDFRLLFGAVIAVALGLAGLMAKGFHWL